jgi:hypothetical protein
MTRRPAAARCVYDEYVTRIPPERGPLMAAQLPHGSFLICYTMAKKGNTMAHSDSQAVREMQRRCHRLLRSLKRPRPCKRCRRPHADRRTSSVP